MHFHFLKCHDPVGAYLRRDSCKRCNWIRAVQQYETPHCGIEWSGQCCSANVSENKLNVSKFQLLGAFPRLLQSGGVHVNADYLSFPADELSQQEGYVTHATTDIQYLHSGRYPGLPEEPLSQRPKEIRLLGKARMFVIRSAQCICWISHISPGL